MTKIDQSSLSYRFNAFLTRNSLFLTQNSLFLLETRFSYSKLTFLTQNSLFLLETSFSYSKLTFLTRNSLFLLETRFSYSKLTFLTRNLLSYSKLTFFLIPNSLFLLETGYSKNRTPWSRGGDRVWTPLKNHKNIGFLSKTGLDRLKITKLPSPQFVNWNKDPVPVPPSSRLINMNNSTRA